MFDNTVYTKSLDELARLVAFGMRDKEFRIFLKQEAMKQIDGDYDVIYEFTKDKAVKGKSTLEDYLHQIAGVYWGKSTKLDELISNVKDFQISVPVNCESWDAENYEPLVTYIPESFDEKTFKFVKAYDSQGHVYAIPLDKEPDRPVIVLGSCERMDRVKYIDPGDGGGRGGTGNIPPDPVAHENLRNIQILNLQRVETWAQGKPELRYIILTPAASPTEDNSIPKSVLPSWSDLKYNFTVINYTLFRWKQRLGDLYTITWIEHDKGWLKTITIGGKVQTDDGEVNLSAIIDVTNKDDKFGTKLIYRDDPYGLIYELNYNGATLRWTRKLE